MKYAMIAVLGLFILWILVESNVGRFYRIVHGDVTPPDIAYNGEFLEVGDIIFDEISLPNGRKNSNRSLCSTRCETILKKSDFDKVYFTWNEFGIHDRLIQNYGRVAKFSLLCDDPSIDSCVVEHSIGNIPKKNNTLVVRLYFLSKNFEWAFVNYIGYEICIGSDLLARYGQVKWYSNTGLAKLSRVWYGSIGKDETGSMIDAGDQLDLLLHQIEKGETQTEGSLLCRRESI